MNATEPSSPTTDEALVRAYTAAWNRADLSAILAHHTDDTAYQLHGGGGCHQGLAAVEAAFAAQLGSFKRLTIKLKTLYLGEAHAVFEPEVTAVPTGGGAPFAFDMLDLLALRGQRIARKDTYVDPVLFKRLSGTRPAPQRVS